jgi:hypothetical protein
MIRYSLEVPMDAKAAVTAEDIQRSKQALRNLEALGYDESTLQRVSRALKPQHKHSDQIKLIAQHLGLSPDGDIATAWIALCRSAGRAHERHYHHDQPVDDEFREAFQKPFEVVLRGLVGALPKRYAALMQRVEALAAMPHFKQATKLFKTEIPGALPLQWHFYQTISSPQWLLTEPLLPVRWSRLSEQIFRIDKWSVCRG